MQSTESQPAVDGPSREQRIRDRAAELLNENDDIEVEARALASRIQQSRPRGRRARRPRSPSCSSDEGRCVNPCASVDRPCRRRRTDLRGCQVYPPCGPCEPYGPVWWPGTSVWSDPCTGTTTVTYAPTFQCRRQQWPCVPEVVPPCAYGPATTTVQTRLDTLCTPNGCTLISRPQVTTCGAGGMAGCTTSLGPPNLVPGGPEVPWCGIPAAPYR